LISVPLYFSQKHYSMTRFYFLLIFILIYTYSSAQTFTQQNIPFYDDNDRLLDLALVGGLNNPQFSEVDLNNDGMQDLYIFDRQGNASLTFINGGTANKVDYHFAPEYAANFPEMTAWVLMRDYNCDGVHDLFFHSPDPRGIRVYQGYYDENKIAFKYIEEYIKYPSFSGFPLNIFISEQDYPAINDIDNDGDLDILTFGSNGGWVSYFENQSQDLGFGCDSLHFELVDNCWGRFYESGVGIELTLSPEIDSCVGNPYFIGKKNSDNIHAGSTLLPIDMDDDGDKEILLGDVSFSTVVMGINGGNPDTAWINSQIIDFPPNTEPIDIPTFPVTFYMDVNNDGKKDLLAAPNRGFSENYTCSWWYENIGSNAFPQFEYNQNDFLVDEMLDFGRGAAPTFFDHNSDGLMDIVVGTHGYYLSGGFYEPSIFLYENTGTASQPAYTLINTNYTNLSAIEKEKIHAYNMTFGDLDNDGDEDMLLGGDFGKLYWYENLDNGNGIASFQNMKNLMNPSTETQFDIGQFASPYLVDIDRNGLLDIVAGELNGVLNFLRNIGTPETPLFLLEDEFFGEIDVREDGFWEGYSDCIVKEIDGEYALFTGGEPGKIRRYINIEDSIANNQSFELADSLFGGILQGARTRIDAADINNDGGLDFIVGNERGGLALYYGEPVVSNTTPDLPEFTANVFPNPAHNALNINYIHPKAQTAELRIYDVLGRTTHEQIIQQNTQLDIQELSKGIYFCKIQIDDQFVVKKFIKK